MGRVRTLSKRGAPGKGAGSAATDTHPASVTGAGALADFDALVTTHAALVARIATTYERRPALVEELVQDVFLAVFRALPRFRGEASLKTFIARIAHNVGVDHVRRATRRPGEVIEEAGRGVADSSRGADGSTDLSLKRERLVVAVRELPVSLRQVMSLHLEDFSNVEIAEALGLSAGNVGVRLHRAKTELKTAMVAAMKVKT